jgi:hypothetical protein
MKKLLIVVVGVLTMAACGNKTKGGEAVDSTLVDSLMTDSVVLGVTDLWTVDAVEAQIHLCFEEVNKMAEADGIYINRLDSMFCSKDFLELQDQLFAKVRESQVMFDGDEGHHWTAGVGSPVTVDSIKSELLTGDQAQAEVWLKDKRGNKGHLELNLYLEDGAWKIHNWIDTDVYPFGSLFTWMQNVLDGNLNDNEDKGSDLNNYAE